MKHWIANHTGIIALVAIFLSLNLIYLFISPEEIVAAIGVNNTYSTLFLIAAFGGLNMLTGGVLYGSIITFAAGGASPWLLGLSGGMGIVVGDALVFYLFRHTSKTLSSDWEQKLSKWKERMRGLPQPVQYLFIYLYLGFFPLPNDLLMFFLALMKYRFIQVLPFIVAGALTFATLTALVGEHLPFYS